MALSPRRGAPAPLASLKSGLALRWREASARERRLVLGAVVVVAGALVWLVLLRPALRTESLAPQRIAQLQEQLALARGQAEELARLAARAPVQARDADLGGAAVRWLSEHGAQVQAAPLPGSVTLQVRQLPASELADFARAARQEWAASIVSARLKLDADGSTLAGSIDLRTQQTTSGASTQASPEQQP